MLIVIIHQLGFVYDGDKLWIRAINPHVKNMGSWQKIRETKTRALRKYRQRKKALA